MGVQQLQHVFLIYLIFLLIDSISPSIHLFLKTIVAVVAVVAVGCKMLCIIRLFKCNRGATRPLLRVQSLLQLLQVRCNKVCAFSGSLVQLVAVVAL